MSDFQPDPLDVLGIQQAAQKIYDETDQATRYKLIAKMNPYMAKNPEVLAAMASLPISTPELLDQAATIYGQATADTIADDLKGMSAPEQRAVFNSMTPAMQQTLTMLGYTPPKKAEDAWYHDILGPAAAAAGFAGHIFDQSGLDSVASYGLNKMTWLGEQAVIRPYRAIRQLSDTQQAAALAGAVTSLVGIALLPETGGASAALLGGGTLRTLGTLGGAAALGGTVGAVVTGPSEWWDAWRVAEHGESTFDRPSQQYAKERLGDPRLINLAKDAAFVMPEGVSLYDIAKVAAGVPEADAMNMASRNAIINLVKTWAPEGTPEYKTMLKGMFRYLEMPEMQDAIAALQKGKISFGRDFADITPFVEPGSAVYNILSGSVDAVSTMAFDPLLIGSNIGKSIQFARRGMTVTEGPEAVNRFLQIANSRPEVFAQHQIIAEAINTKNLALIDQYAPGLRGLYLPLLSYRDDLARTGQLVNNTFSVKNFHDYMIGEAQLKTLMQGYGTVPGMNNGIMLTSLTRRSKAFRDFAGRARSFAHGLTDARMDNFLREWIDGQSLDDLRQMFPEATFDDLLVDAPRKELIALRDRKAALEKTLKEEWDNLDEAQRNYQIASSPPGMHPYATLDPEYGNVLLSIDEKLRMLPRELAKDGLTDAAIEQLISQDDLFTTSRFLGRAVGSKLGKGAFTIGRAVESISTLVPPGTALYLIGPQAPSDIKKMTELGAFFGMPEWMRSRYANMILWQPTVEKRMSAVQAFMDNMFKLGGFHATDEGKALADTFVHRMKMSYAAGGLDTLTVNGAKSKQMIYLSEAADMISVPDLKEMRRAVKTGALAKLIGVSDMRYLEQFMNRIWKPSVLLRIGFIPRAAGEEMLSYMLRGGLGSLGQELGARSIEHAKQYGRIAELKAKGLVLNAADERLFNSGGMPAGLRKLSRMLDRYDWADPMNKVLEHWSVFWRDLLENGFGVEDNVNSALSRIANQPRSMYNIIDQANPAFAGQMLSPTAQRLRSNTATILDSLVLGNTYSWRRMAMGGVHDDLLNAAKAWYEQHGTTILREVGATEAGIYDPGTSRDDVIRLRVDDGTDGAAQYQEYVVVRGQRELRANGDWGFANAVHHQMVRPVEDEISRRLIAPEIARIRTGMENLPVDDAIDAFYSMDPYDAQLVASQFLGAPDHRLFNGMLDVLAQRGHEKLALYLQRTVLPQEFTYGRVLSAIEQYVKDNRIAVRADQLLQDLRKFAPYAQQMDTLSLSERRFLGSAIAMHQPDYALLGEQAQFGKAVSELNNWIASTSEDNLYNLLSTMYFEDQRLPENAMEGDVPRLLAGLHPKINGKHWITGNYRERYRNGELTALAQEFPNIELYFDQLDMIPTLVFQELSRRNLGTSARDIAKQLVLRDPAYRGGYMNWSLRDLDGMLEAMPSSQIEMMWREIEQNWNLDGFSLDEAGFGNALFNMFDEFRRTNPTATYDDFLNESAFMHDLRSTIKAVSTDASGEPGVERDVLSIIADALTNRNAQLYHNVLADSFSQITPVWDEVLGKWLEGQGLTNSETNRSILQRVLNSDQPDFSTKIDGKTPDWDSLIMTNFTFIRDGLNDLWDLNLAINPTMPIRRVAYGSWNEAADAIRPRLIAELQRPENAWMLGHVQGQASLMPEAAGEFGVRYRTGEFGGKFEEAIQHDGMVTLWQPPHAAHFLAMYDDGHLDELRPLLTTGLVSADPKEQETFQAALEVMLSGEVPIFADRQLAEKFDRNIRYILNRNDPAALPTAGGFTSDALAIDLNRSLLRSSLEEIGFSKRFELDGRTEVFSMQANAPVRLRNPSVAAQDDVTKIADRMIERTRQVWTRGNREVLVPKARLLDDGTTESMVYRLGINGPEPLMPGEMISAREEFIDHAGRKIDFGDENYFDRQALNGNDQVMWEAVGPILEDAADELYGRIIYSRKPIVVDVGEKATDSELVRLYRGRVKHVQDAGNDVPNFTDAEVLTEYKRSHWDDFVNYSFNKVIGPSIDALARRPMAFHFFAQRYMQNIAMRDWLLDPKIAERMQDIVLRTSAVGSTQDIDLIADEVRALGQYLTSETSKTAKWSNGNALGWFRSHTNDEVDELIQSALDSIRLDLNTKNLSTAKQIELNVARQRIERLAARRYEDVRAILPSNHSANDFLAYVQSELPAGSLDDIANINSMRKPEPRYKTEAAAKRAAARLEAGETTGRGSLITTHPVLKTLTDDDWLTLIAYNKNRATVMREAGENAAVAAINDMMPFIDSHKIKSQFAEYGRGFLPFWYAEENFMKRWARTLSLEGPAAIRKAQLGYMGLKQAGVVRTDSNGQDWFVYPGSNLLQEAVNKIPGMPDLPVGVLFQSPTDMMLPGISTRIGEPSLGPLATIPMKLIVTAFPELELQDEYRYIVGDITAQRSIKEQLFPTQALKLIQAVSGGGTDSAQYASAWFSAVANLEASGQGLKDNATTGEIDNYIRTINDHARIIMFAQALGGYIAPGPLTSLTTQNEYPIGPADVTDVANGLADMYQTYVKEFGIEEGTLEYLRMVPNTDIGQMFKGNLNPDTGLYDVKEGTNPLAFVVPRNVSRSGAPLPATEIALSFFNENSDYMKSFPMAGPYLLPNDPSIDSPFSQYAYDQQTVNEMRRRRTPEEFLNQLKYKEGATIYFRERKAYMADVEAARANGNEVLVKKLNAAWTTWSSSFNQMHPVFYEELTSSDSRERRKQVIDEMRMITRDSEGAPQTPHLSVLKTMMETYDDFLAVKTELSMDGSAGARKTLEQLKLAYETFMDDLVMKTSAVQAFWLGVLRPESELE